MNRHPANNLFHAIASATLPTWADYERADNARKTEIRNQWRNAWRDDAAQRLLFRAAGLERIKHQARLDAESRERIARMPTPIGPPGGYRNPLVEDRFADLDSRDVKHALANEDTWSITPKQSNS